MLEVFIQEQLSKSSVDYTGKKAVRCYKCGRTHTKPCTNNHSDANHDKTCPWFASPNGRAWKQRGEKFLPEDITKTLANTPLVTTQPVVPTASQQVNQANRNGSNKRFHSR